MLWFRRTSDDPYFNNPEKLKELMEGDEEFVLVDVRSHEEYADGYIPGARHIPYEKIGDSPPTDDPSELIVLYCHSGGRSDTAKRTLERMGYERVHNFGGVVHWPDELDGGEQ
jgi:rhodanese-related sulfurtransferase